MSTGSSSDKPVFQQDYDLERWAFRDPNNPEELEADSEGKVQWHSEYPTTNEWDRIGIVTLNFDIEGEGDFRNYRVSPDRPLDPWGVDTGRPDHYDLDDLALQAFLDYEFEF